VRLLLLMCLVACTDAKFGSIGNRDGGDRDAASDAGASGCDSTRPPERVSGLGGGDQTAFFAIRRFVMDQGPAWQTTGFDLDRVCTIDQASSSCTDGADSAITDGERGIDNALGNRLSSFIASIIPPSGPEMSSGQDRLDEVSEAGFVNLLIELQGWNGTDTDSDLVVIFHQGTCAIPGTTAASCALYVDRPLWDGNDTFFPDVRGFQVDGVTPRSRIDSAYMTERVVVVPLPNAFVYTLRVDASSIPIGLAGGFVVLELSSDFARVERGVVSGRWARASITEAFDFFGLCDPGRRFVAEMLLSQAVDIRADTTTDSMGFACDALSVGVQVTGDRFARLGPPMMGAAAPAGCM
jgi:hypothetical protein